MSPSDPLDPASRRCFSTIDRIRSMSPTLRRAEQRVAEAVLADIHAASRMSTRDLARRAAVSEPTVVRFARRVGCEGFTDLKLRLSEEFVTGRMFVQSRRPVISDDADAVAGQVYEGAAQALSLSFAQRDPVALHRAAEVISRAERVLCMGTGGSSANVALEAENRLFRFDIRIGAIVDEYKQRVGAAICTERDALLIFSVTGRPHALRDCVDIARSAGAHVIAVTRADSPLAEASDTVLTV